jgi:hypothetical protein
VDERTFIESFQHGNVTYARELVFGTIGQRKPILQQKLTPPIFLPSAAEFCAFAGATTILF